LCWIATKGENKIDRSGSNNNSTTRFFIARTWQFAFCCGTNEDSVAAFPIQFVIVAWSECDRLGLLESEKEKGKKKKEKRKKKKEKRKKKNQKNNQFLITLDHSSRTSIQSQSEKIAIGQFRWGIL
jgi:hypothetical protein